MSYFLNNVICQGCSGLKNNWANFVADVGDYCLSGARAVAHKYWDGGKTYRFTAFEVQSQDKTSISAISSHKYEDESKDWKETLWKVLSLVLVLPFIFGVLCKAVSMINTEVRLRHKYTVGAEEYTVGLTEAENDRLCDRIHARRPIPVRARYEY